MGFWILISVFGESDPLLLPQSCQLCKISFSFFSFQRNNWVGALDGIRFYTFGDGRFDKTDSWVLVPHCKCEHVLVAETDRSYSGLCSFNDMVGPTVWSTVRISRWLVLFAAMKKTEDGDPPWESTRSVQILYCPNHAPTKVVGSIYWKSKLNKCSLHERGMPQTFTQNRSEWVATTWDKFVGPSLVMVQHVVDLEVGQISLQ